MFIHFNPYNVLLATSPKLIDKTNGKNNFNTICFQQSLSKNKTHFHSKSFRMQKNTSLYQKEKDLSTSSKIKLQGC
jgi:hypothetical protein